MDILEKIFTYKKEEYEHRQRQIPLQDLKSRARDVPETISFWHNLKNPRAEFAVIAEVKRKSPSKGVIREDFDPLAIAAAYEENGASALSVLTDEHFFGGSLDYLEAIRRQSRLPLLRKDFLWMDYQLYEARDAGADAILLIAAMLELSQVVDLMGLAKELTLDVLLEIHDAEEAELADRARANIVGVNHRSLKTFHVDLAGSKRLFPLLQHAEVKVSESGIDSRHTLESLHGAGADAFLVGESLMRCPDVGLALKKLIEG